MFTAEGDKIGTIERVVIDPGTKEVSHVIVQQGLLFTEDKVVPIDLIAQATDERVILEQDVGDLEAMPKFEERRSIPAVCMPEALNPPPDRAQPLYYVSPIGSRWWDYAGRIRREDEEGTRYVRRTRRNVPEGTVVLEEGAEVISADGEHVGDVAQVFADEEDGYITHLLISRGLLFKEERLVPVSWIDKVREETVHLSVESLLLGELQPYLPIDRPDEEDPLES